MNTLRSLSVALGAAVWFGSAVHAQMVVLEPEKDNTLFEEPDGLLSNGAGAVLFAGLNNNEDVRRAVLAFDVDAIPPCSLIQSASLQLVVDMSSSPISFSFKLHRLTAAWGEGTSSTTGGIGAPATSGDATWIHTYFPLSFWSRNGGDYVPTSSAIRTVSDVGAYTWSSTQLALDVQSWLDGAHTNAGWILIGNEAALQSVKRFKSREAISPAERPLLTVFYTAGALAAVATRNEGTNPLSYSAGPPVLGSTFTATVDNALAGQTFSALFAFEAPASIQLGNGQTLLCLDLGSGELLTGAGASPSSSIEFVDHYSLPVPNNPAACGVVIHSQAVHFGVPPFVLSNAQDLTLGG